MRRWSLFSSLILALVAIACEKKTPVLSVVTDHPTFRAGQVWRYSTRPGEEGSTLLIQRVERDAKLGIIIHIGVSGLNLRGVVGAKGEIGHMPFAESAVTRSVVNLASQGEPPPISEGYRLWRQAFDEGKGGVFTISVAEAVSFVEQTMQHPPDGQKRPN
jgi:hypothetical protein